MTSAKPDTGYGLSLAGIGAAIPQNTITNDDLTQLVDTSDEWIRSRTGIGQRHVVSGDQSVADLAAAAARDALESAGMQGEDIELIIVGTSTPDAVYPAVSCRVQHAIGATNAAGFDMAMACSGFVYGLVIAQQFLRTGMYKNALVIGADIHSRFMDWYDRNICVLFGDGAGAAILTAEPGGEDHFLASDLHIDGSKGQELTLNIPSQNCPLVAPRSEVSPYVHMNGREMFRFAVGIVPESIRTVASQAGVSLEDVDHFVLHQANIRIMQAMSEKLDIPKEKLVTNLETTGNTSAASIPIALNEAVLTGQVKPGDLLILCGFGAGAAWGSTALRWTCVDQRTEKMQACQKELVR